MAKMQEIDWRLSQLFRFRPIVLFDQITILEEALERFQLHHFKVCEVECEALFTQREFLNAILHQIEVGGESCENISQILFWDLLRDIKIPEGTGLVLAFKHFDAFYQRDAQSAQAVLKSISQEHFVQLYNGLRWFTCVHSDDKSLALEPLITFNAHWNKMPSFSQEADLRLERLRILWSALREAEEILVSRIPVGTQLHARLSMSKAVAKALQSVTGKEASEELAEMNLSASDIVRLLENFDFTKSNTW